MSTESTTHRYQGFSLIEMMVSMAILALITVYLTDMLVRQSRTYTVVDQVTEVQQNMRVISDIIEREMRTTGFMTGEAGVFCAVDLLGAPDILVVSDDAPFDPTDQPASNMVVDITDAEYTGAGTDTFNVATILEGAAFYDVDGNATLDSDFFDVQPAAALPMPFGQSGGVIVYDQTNSGAGVACGRIVPGSVTATRLQVDWTFGLPGAIYAPAAANLTPPAGDLVMVPAIVYQIDQGGAVAVPPVTSQLLRNGLVIAQDVEDMQLAAWFDVDNDDVQDAGEYFGARTAAPADPLAGVQYLQNQRNNQRLREIRVNLMLRTRTQDANVLATGAQPQGQYPNLENRNTAQPVADAFVRRVHTLAIRPRNVGHRIDSL
ncbi:MAG: prepilin-type N-terminal cleavage/methylation domain-containing protein [bacterium]|nr:prepilin-type N-terminal cleavage/methylation domain-containing protein [bacterium]